MPTELFGTLRGQIVAGENIEMDIRLLGVGDVESSWLTQTVRQLWVPL